jgi:hypothetical protein
MSKLAGPNSKDLTHQELNYLLKVLAEARFDGKDVLLLAEIVKKLSDKLK